MDLQGGSSNLQGGTGISQPTQQLYTQPINTQPGTGISQYPAVYNGSTLGAETTAQAAPVWTDPTGQGLSQTQYNNLVSGFNAQDQAIHSSSNDAATNSALGLHSSILDYLYGLQKGQNNINEAGYQSELAKKQGLNSIMDMVGQGIQSGGVLLAGKNAGSSSGSEAIARAYAKIGQREASNVGGQYDQTQHKIGLDQADLQAQAALGKTKIDESKQVAINNIVIDARNKLAALNAAQLNASLPQQLDIEAEKQQIQNSITGILSQYDSTLSSGMNAITPRSAADNQALAFQNANKVASSTPYNFTSSVPVQFQGTGPFASDLPLFTLPSSKKQTA